MFHPHPNEIRSRKGLGKRGLNNIYLKVRLFFSFSQFPVKPPATMANNNTPCYQPQPWPFSCLWISPTAYQQLYYVRHNSSAAFQVSFDANPNLFYFCLFLFPSVQNAYVKACFSWQDFKKSIFHLSNITLLFEHATSLHTLHDMYIMCAYRYIHMHHKQTVPGCVVNMMRTFTSN